MIIRSIILVCSLVMAAVVADATPAQTESQKFAQAARVLIASVAAKSGPLIERKSSGGASLSEDEEKELTQQCLKLERLRKFLGRWCAEQADDLARTTHTCDGTKSYSEDCTTIICQYMQDIGVCIGLIAEAGFLYGRVKPHVSDYQLLEQMYKKLDHVVVEGDIFCVPSRICSGTIADILDNPRTAFYTVGLEDEDSVVYNHRVAALYKETASVQVQATTPGYDAEGWYNWADHGHPRLYKFPTNLPLSLFIDADGKLKKEGDTVILEHYNPLTNEQIKIVLRLSQGKYRYKECGGGHFERCIKACSGYERNVAPFLSDAGRAELSGT